MKSTSIAVLALAMTVAGVSRGDEPPFRGDIGRLAEQNADFRHVLFTGHNIQVVAMSLNPGEDIGEEVHNVDQCFFFVRGTAQTVVEGTTAMTGKNGALCVPAGMRHNVRNKGRDELKLYTTYAPPQHPPGTIHHTKADAQRAEETPPPKAK